MRKSNSDFLRSTIVDRRPKQPATGDQPPVMRAENLFSNLPSRSVFLRAAAVWKHASIPRGLKVPAWYCHLWGLPLWYMRQSNQTLKSERRRALPMIVRMNFLMDREFYRSLGKNFSLFEFSPCFSLALRSFGLTLREYISQPSVNVSWMAARLYKWEEVLSCTLRNFVNLGPFGPDLT